MSPPEAAAITLYVGGYAGSVQRRRCCVTGPRCFSPSWPPLVPFTPDEAARVEGLLDSGAYTDVRPGTRLSPEAALQRQLSWEARAGRKWGLPTWRAKAFVSYDLLIDEKWVDGRKRKERWSVAEADRAVRVTVDAAGYLASQRARLAPRRLVLACQGVVAEQYVDCVQGVLAHATPADTLGLGGWCILGKCRRWLPEFWRTVRRVLPLAAGAGLRSVHVFGVLYRPALGGLLWLCDQHGLALSTDSKKPILDPTHREKVSSGACPPTWEENLALWRARLEGLRSSAHYREPPDPLHQRQLFLPAGSKEAWP
jgi:hypothetical protein